MAVTYLSEEDILEIHSIVVDETGGSHGVRDHGAIAVIVAQPRQAVFGKEVHESVLEKAAAYARGIALNHPFVDGNKRTAVSAMGVFLADNGYDLVTQEGELYDLAQSIIAEKLEVAAIAEWLGEHRGEL